MRVGTGSGGLSPELIKQAQQALKNDGKISADEYEKLIETAGPLTDQKKAFLANLDNEATIQAVKDADFTAKDISFEVNQADKTLQVGGTIVKVASLREKASEAKSYNDYFSLVKEVKANNSLSKDELAALVEARKSVFQNGQVTQQEKDSMVQSYEKELYLDQGIATNEAKTLYDPYSGEVDARFGTDHIFADQELLGNPKRYAHNLVVKYQKEHGKAPSLDEMLQFMKTNLPPIQSAWSDKVASKDNVGKATDTADGNGFCSVLADYAEKTLKFAGEKLGIEKEVGERVSIIKVTEEDGDDKHFVVGIRGKNSPEGDMVADLWMGGGTDSGLDKSFGMKIRLGISSATIPEAIDTRQKWEQAAKVMWPGTVFK